MTSRERVGRALAHQEPDRIPLDLGGSATTGMQVSSVYLLRQALGLDPPGAPVKVVEPYQMLGEIKPDLQGALGVDVVQLPGPRTMFGFPNQGWKEWRLFDGTPVLVPEAFNTEVEPDGSLLMYPEGDKSVPPSARMPKDGFYFDSLKRQEPIDESKLNPEDNLEEFGPVSDADLAHFAREAKRLYEETDKAILGNFGGTAFGDIALVPAPWLKHPKGIRDVESGTSAPSPAATTSTKSSSGSVRSVSPTSRRFIRRWATALRWCSSPGLTSARSMAHSFLPRLIGTSTSPSTRSSTDGFTRTLRGRPLPTPAARCGTSTPISSKRDSISTTRCSARRRRWSRAD